MDLLKELADVQDYRAYQFVLPWPKGVTTNHLYVKGRWGFRLSPAAVAWRNTVIVTVREVLTRRGWAVEPPLGDLSFVLHAFPPNAGQHDPDNLLKFALDSVMAGLLATDEKVRHVEATMHLPDKKKPRLFVRLEGFHLIDRPGALGLD